MGFYRPCATIYFPLQPTCINPRRTRVVQPPEKNRFRLTHLKTRSFFFLIKRKGSPGRETRSVSPKGKLSLSPPPRHPRGKAICVGQSNHAESVISRALNIPRHKKTQITRDIGQGSLSLMNITGRAVFRMENMRSVSSPALPANDHCRTEEKKKREATYSADPTEILTRRIVTTPRGPFHSAKATRNIELNRG